MMPGARSGTPGGRALRSVAGLFLALSLLALAWRPVPFWPALGASVLAGLAFWRLGRRAPGETRPARRTRTAEIGLAAAAVVFTLGAVEIAARLLFEFHPYADTPYVRHPKYFFVPRPHGSGTFDVNLGSGRYLQVPFTFSGQGLRDREFGPKAPDEFRILLLGDSFVMGWGLPPDQTIPAQLERLLQPRQPQRRITVINAGVSGYGPFQEAGILEDRGLALRPDLVLLQLFPANDIENSLAQVGKRMRAYDFGWQRHLLEFVNQNRWPVRAERWLHNHSRAVNAWLGTTRRHGAIATFLDDLRFLPASGLDIPAPSEDRPWWIEVSLRDWYPELDEGFGLMKRDILAIRSLCETHHIGFAAFTLAGGQDFIDEYWNFAVQRAPGGTVYERGKEVRILREFYDASGIRSIDVMDALRRDPNPGELYYQYDGHLRPHGAEVVARSIADFLDATGSVPGR